MSSSQLWGCRAQEQVVANMKLNIPKCASGGCQVSIAERSPSRTPCQAALPANAYRTMKKPGFMELRSTAFRVQFHQ